jgi:hypothetical protein
MQIVWFCVGSARRPVAGGSGGRWTLRWRGWSEQAVQLVVDDGLGLFGRGLAGENAGAQACGHGYQGDGFQVRVQVGGCVVGGLGGLQLGGEHVGHGG